MVLLMKQSVRPGTKAVSTELNKPIPKAVHLCMSLYYQFSRSQETVISGDITVTLSK